MRTVIFEVKSCKLAETLDDFLEVSVRFIGVILRFGIVSRWFFHDYEWLYNGFLSFRGDAMRDLFLPSMKTKILQVKSCRLAETFNENTGFRSYNVQIR